MPRQIHLTVAALVPGVQGFLMVKEKQGEHIVINQPAGHVEPGEGLLEAVKRETFEETGWRVEPRHLLGISIYTSPHNQVTYYRIAFLCEALEQDKHAALDSDIIEALWLSEAQLRARQSEMRSPLVIETLDAYCNGKRYPLEIIEDYR
ncbi:MAG: NUDIX hydrolase [Gammaproteobacteria bacterium]|nr:NUDIX hydrolase [Gammaproteobacteria bacterium]MBQ0840614.1 NUDIX hydrolase [Gammaproteobacteria bacterium]